MDTFAIIVYVDSGIVLYGEGLLLSVACPWMQLQLSD